MPPQSVIFTDRLEEYITTPPAERKDKYGANQIRQNDYKLKKYAKAALKNLGLIAAGYEEKRVREIFDVEVMEFLLKAVIPKIGHDRGGFGRYYNVLIHAIAEAANSNMCGDREIIEVDVKTHPLASKGFGGYDTTDPDSRKHTLAEFERLKKTGKY